MDAAGTLLAERPVRVLAADLDGSSNGFRHLTLTTRAIDSVDVYVNGRPVATTETADGTTELDVELPPAAESMVHLEGFDDGQLVAARLLHA